jgi:hypothetical protein
MLIGISCGLIEARRDAKYCVSAFRHGGGVETQNFASLQPYLRAFTVTQNIAWHLLTHKPLHAPLCVCLHRTMSGFRYP